MFKKKIHDDVLGDLMTSMDDRRTGHMPKPILSIDIMAGGVDDDGAEPMEYDEMEEYEGGKMEGLPGAGGWDEYLKRRYGRK